MSQTYEVMDFKIGTFQDNYGNTWCNMALKGQGEPITIVLKDPTTVKVGDSLTGDIKDATSKANKPYLRFYKEKQEGGYSNSSQGTTKPKQTDEYWSDKDAGIKAQMAVKASANLWSNKEWSIKDIEETAISLLNIVEKIKVSSNSEPVTGQDEVHDFDINDQDIINLDDIPF